MHAPGIWGILIVAVVVVLLFGRGKISGMMGEVASGIKAFQRGMRDDETQRPATTTATVAPATTRLDTTTTTVRRAPDGSPLPDAVEIDHSKDA
jgi:sec-independent protein translocase protein TatA